MYNSRRYYPVNWMDGMKMNKDIFIAQDNATQDAINQVGLLNISPQKYGILSCNRNSEDNFQIKASIDNQNVLHVLLHKCNAITIGGISIEVSTAGSTSGTDGAPSSSLSFSTSTNNSIYWIVLIANPFQHIPFGNPNPNETPSRFPYVTTEYKLQIVPEDQYNQFVNHPFALFVGKVLVNGNNIVVDEDYIPPCYSISAHPYLVDLYGELDNFLNIAESCCCKIVQKIYAKSQKNELSDLVMFLCDRVILYLGECITSTKWIYFHESPYMLFSSIAALGRIMKNTIDLRIGTGKDELLAYLGEWCGLRPGDLENIFTNVAYLRYDNNDINKCIKPIADFAKVSKKLFETLSNLDFIGKRKETGFFVKEEHSSEVNKQPIETRERRRFFGG